MNRNLTPFEEFWPQIAREITPLEETRIPVEEANGRILRRTVLAPSDMPGFDKSAMDGFAVRAVDVVVGRDLPLAGGQAYAGNGAVAPLEPGTAVPIGTGGQIPAGADAVLVKEHADRDDAVVRPTHGVEPGENIRYKGGEYRAGEPLLEPGFRLHPRALASLAAAGVREVTVGRRPRVAVVPTGNELAPPGADPLPGQIHDATGPFLRSSVTALLGEEPLSRRAPADDEASLVECFRSALSEVDVLVIAGGVSVGDRDLVKNVLEETCGVERLLWRVAVKPGKPVYVGRAGARWVLGLPGNPASAIMHWNLMVRPLLLALQGAARPQPLRIPLHLRREVQPDPFRTRLHWSGLSWESDGPWAEPFGRTESHMLSRLSIADVLAIIPAGDAPVAAGSRVEGLILERD